jgi:hypothetical protein
MISVPLSINRKRALRDALKFVREKLEEYKEKGDANMVSRAIDAERQLEKELGE